MTAPKELYPFSTQDGRAIPVDIAMPVSLVAFSFTANTPQGIIIPAGFTTCYVFASKDCILRLNNTALPAGLVSGTEYDNAIFIPGNLPMTLLLAPGNAQLLGGANAGTLYLNSIEQWAALHQPAQTSVA